MVPREWISVEAELAARELQLILYEPCYQLSAAAAAAAVVSSGFSDSVVLSNANRPVYFVLAKDLEDWLPTHYSVSYLFVD